MQLHIDSNIAWTWEDIHLLLSEKTSLSIEQKTLEKVQKNRTFLNQKNDTESAIYGVNTGFGALYNQKISTENLTKLQENLVLSHACGMGNEVATEITRLMLAFKIKGLSLGHSGIQPATLQRLIDLYNNQIYPVIYEQGSLGASGDLAPLAHLSLPLINEGKVYENGIKKDAKKVNKKHNWQSINFQSKEGLALLNGTQFMSSYGAFILMKFEKLWNWANFTAAISLEAYDGRMEPFSPLLHQIRPHKGQQKVADLMLQYLNGSEIIAQAKEHVQDPYSFRCVPQVHGASYDALEYVKSVFLTEVNAVTDNPTIFHEENEILSGGNFHGQPLAISLDFLAIAMAEIGSISERRVYQLINGHRHLPAFLTPNPGLNSGFMIAQYTAASIVSQNKQLCTPASVDSIDSSKGQEDHVSMGANAATKALKIVENLEKILAIELLTAMQALEFRRPKKSSPQIEACFAKFRQEIPFIKEDVLMKDYLDKSVNFLSNYMNDAI